MFDIEDNVSVINLILIIMLFFNCVLSIDMYRQSYCNEDKDCPSYITIDKTNGTDETDGTDEKFADPTTTLAPITTHSPIGGKCGSLPKLKSKGSFLGGLIISILIFVFTIIIQIVEISVGEYTYDFILITVSILNIIVSSMNFAIYDRCTKSKKCTIDTKYAEEGNDGRKYRLDGDKYSTKCLSKKNKDVGAGVFIFIIIVLVVTLLALLPIWYKSLD